MQDKLITYLFSAFIILPSLLYVIGIRNDNQVTREKKIGQVEIRNLKDVFKGSEKIDTKLLKEFPGRPELMQVGFKSRIWLGAYSTPKVIHGRNSWKFTSGAHVVDYAIGQRTYDIPFWNKLISETQSFFSTLGADFYFLIAPNKHRIYPNRLPPYLENYFQFQNTPDYISHIDPNISFVNLFPVLKRAANKRGDIIYHRSGTHWNWRGGYIAAQHAIDKVRESNHFIPKLELSLESQKKGKLMDDSFEDMVAPRKERRKHSVHNSELPCPPATDSILVKRNGPTPMWDTRLIKTHSSGPRLLLIGDSFTEFNYRFYLCSFSEVLMMHHLNGRWDKKIAEQFEPDVVIYEVVERFLHQKFTNIFAPAEKKKKRRNDRK